MQAAALIADALMRAEACPADVRKAAMLRISRVQTIVAPEQTHRTLEAGLANIDGLPEAQHRGFEQLSRLIVAAVAPQRLGQLPLTRDNGMFSADHLTRVMCEHGHEEYLRTYVLHDAPLIDVPLSGIAHLLSATKNEQERLALLRRAIEVCRVTERNPRMGASLHQFHLLFQQWWKILPREEALATLREIVGRILENSDSEIRGQIGDARFTSCQALHLFQSFDVLLELDPERAEQLAVAHPELAAALERYPRGLQSIEEEAKVNSAKMPPREPNQRVGFGRMGGKKSLEYGWALFEAEKTGDFSKPLEYAAARYREDSDPKNPNMASKAFWLSGAMYQAIFYRMGKTSRQDVAVNMDVVPDAELRLLAQIELAAGICALPELRSASITQRMR